MRIAGTIQESIVDGPGLRFTLFTQGCPHNCEGCHNPETHDPNGGSEMGTDEIIKKLLANPLTDGITFSGGEPFAQSGDCAAIAKAAKENSLNVWAYSGYTFEALLEKSESDEDIREFLSHIDVLVDGPFVLTQRSLSIPWRGSRNQRVIDVKKSLEAGETVLFME